MTAGTLGPPQGKVSKDEAKEAEAREAIKRRDAFRSVCRWLYGHPYCRWLEILQGVNLSAEYVKPVLIELTAHMQLRSSQDLAEEALAARRTWQAAAVAPRPVPMFYRFADNAELESYFEKNIQELLDGMPLRQIDESKLPSYVRARREREKRQAEEKANREKHT